MQVSVKLSVGGGRGGFCLNLSIVVDGDVYPVSGSKGILWPPGNNFILNGLFISALSFRFFLPSCPDDYNPVRHQFQPSLADSCTSGTTKVFSFVHPLFNFLYFLANEHGMGAATCQPPCHGSHMSATCQ